MVLEPQQWNNKWNRWRWHGLPLWCWTSPESIIFFWEVFFVLKCKYRRYSMENNMYLSLLNRSYLDLISISNCAVLYPQTLLEKLKKIWKFIQYAPNSSYSWSLESSLTKILITWSPPPNTGMTCWYTGENWMGSGKIRILLTWLGDCPTQLCTAHRPKLHKGDMWQMDLTDPKVNVGVCETHRGGPVHTVPYPQKRIFHLFFSLRWTRPLA